MVIHMLKYKRRKVIYYIYSDVYHFCCSSLISKVLIFSLRSLKNFFNVYFSAGLLATKPLSFLSFETISISPSYFQDVFMRCEFSVDRFFLSGLHGCCEKPTVTHIFILLLVCHFSPAAFKIALFPLVFTVWWWWFHLNLSCLMFSECLWICTFLSFTEIGICQ